LNDRRTLLLTGFVVVLVVVLAYPAGFFGWYLTAERVTATITSCPAGTPHPLRCPTYGEWRLGDGSTGKGRIYAQTTSPRDVGRSIPARATDHWAVAEGVTASAPGTYALIALVVDLLLAGVVIVGRGLSRRAR
jgi:hypothetical protein